MSKKKSVKSGAFGLIFKYQSYNCATKFRKRNSYVHRQRAELWPNDWILHHDNAPAHKAFSISF
jgi:hypothetical protein